jgi:hypothetical protein
MLRKYSRSGGNEERIRKVMKVESESAAQERLGRLEALGVGLADWSQRWFPDAFVFELLAGECSFIPPPE